MGLRDTHKSGGEDTPLIEGELCVVAVPAPLSSSALLVFRRTLCKTLDVQKYLNFCKTLNIVFLEEGPMR